MFLIRHLPRPPGVLAPGKYLRLQTERVMAHAARIEKQEREKLRAKEVTIHIPEPEPQRVFETREERRQREFREMRTRQMWSRAWEERVNL